MNLPDTYRPYRSTRLRLTIGKAEALGFAYGASSTVFVQIYGQLYISEIIVLCVVLLVGPISIMKRHRALPAVAVGYLLLLLGLIIADIGNSSSTGDALRGWANAIFALLDVIFVTYVLRLNLKAILYVLLGLAVARLFNTDLMDFAAAAEGGNNFKARVVPVLTPLVLILSFFASQYKKSAAELLFLATGLGFIALGARSQGIIMVITAAVLLNLRVSPRRGQRLLMLVGLSAVGYGMYVVYVGYVLSTGMSGNAYDQLVSASNPYNPFALLAQGRSELFVALAAIGDAPILGKGSWAPDLTGYYSTGLCS